MSSCKAYLIAIDILTDERLWGLKFNNSIPAFPSDIVKYDDKQYKILRAETRLEGKTNGIITHIIYVVEEPNNV